MSQFSSYSLVSIEPQHTSCLFKNLLRSVLLLRCKVTVNIRYGEINTSLFFSIRSVDGIGINT